MKYIALFLLPLIIFSNNIYAAPYSGDVEMLNELHDSSLKTLYENKTKNCQEYARRSQGKYAEATIYKACCMMEITFDNNSKFPPENLGRVNKVLSEFKKGEELCGNGLSDCLRKYLKNNSAEYRCNE